MRPTLAILVGVCSLLGACSGDAHRAVVSPDSRGAAGAAGSGEAGSAAAGSGSGSGSGAAVVSGPTPAPLSVEMADPTFASGAAADGATAFGLERWAEARAAFERALADTDGDPALTSRLGLMLALCDTRLGNWKAAAAGLATARAALPLLADWIGYQEARALYFAKDLAGAKARAAAIDPASTSGAEAELLLGDVLRAGKDPVAIATHYATYLTARPSGMRRSEARFRLAEASEQLGDAAGLVAAAAAYRAILVDDPVSSWAGKAAPALAALRPKLPTDGSAPPEGFTAAEQLVRAHALFDAMRNAESEAAFTEALAAADLTAEQRCDASYHRAQSRFKARDRKQAAPWFDEAIAACATAANVDLQIKAAYQAGRSYAFEGDHKIAIERYQTAQTVDPTHSYADDALLREAEEWTSLGDAAKVEATLGALPTRFPQGDNRAEAMWRLGWQAWKAGKTMAAIGWWEKQIATVPIDDNYFGEGQAQYWIGRAQHQLGKTDAALASWEAGIKLYPLAYYSLLGLNRMREVAPKRFEALMTELTTDPAGFDPAAPAFSFTPRVEYGTPGFARAMELLRLGLGDAAEAELRALGLAAPAGKSRVDDPDTIEKLWAMVYLFDRAGRYGTSHWPTRWHILDYRRSWPIGRERARWRIAYPKAYWELLSRHAATNGVPVALQIAIAREESAFDPLLESYANAIGLTQMIFPTAERFAKGTGITVSRDTLRDPEKNVTIGSRFLGYLVTYRKGFIHLVPPSYNAGEAGVNRMLKLRGTMAADEFIEAIVDDQARNYSKRVLASYFTYGWLEDASVPPMPNKIPRDTWPQ
jgi:soluble lytic murein transglycosylase